MSSDPSAEETRMVREGPVTVTKSFEAEEFPVPAVKFVVDSDAAEQVNVRLVDSIPESFPMEHVGFHPDFEKDNWTAYKSHRVEYDRTLEPGESTTTVYGVRLDDTDLTAEAFLTAPTLSLLDADDVGAADQAIDDVLGEDSNKLVRDVLSGERDALPGLGADDGVDAPDLTAAESNPPEDIELNLDLDDDADDADGDAPKPDAFDDSGDSATEQTAQPVVAAVGDSGETAAESEPGEGPREDLALDLDLDGADGRDGRAEGDDAAAPTESTGESTDEPHRRPPATDGSVVAALAAELDRDEADADDVAALREALGVDDDSGVPRSVDLRIGRLQSQVEDLTAYSSALAEFLDEEGTAEELIEGFRADVHEFEEELDELSAGLADAEDDRGRLHEDVTDLQSGLAGLDDRLDAVEDSVDDAAERLDGVDDRLDTVEDRVGEATDRLDDVDERVGTVESRLDEVVDRVDKVDDTAARLDEEMGEVREELATLDGDIAAAREAFEDEAAPVREDVEALQDELAALDETVEEFRAFRDRLSNALGPMVGGGNDAVGEAHSGDADGEEGGNEDGDADAADDGEDDS